MSKILLLCLVVSATVWSGDWLARAANDTASEGDPQRFTAPAGFRIERVAANALTGSLWAMTFDHRGRLVVSREQGPIFTLIDGDGDGTYEAARQFDTRLTHSEGLCFVKGSLYTIGQGPDWVGVYRLTDVDGDDRADTIETIGKFTSLGVGEHAPHGVIYGPDGYIHVMVGNHAQLPESTDPQSPLDVALGDHLLSRYADANGHARGVPAPGGTVARIDIESKRWTRVAGGFRNAYDMAFNAAGELFTYDSDMEWDLQLPWYRPTRINHVVPSGDYGWRHGSGKWPSYFADSLPTTIDMGRGSPCGMVFYEHNRFPEKYRGALFMCDWSRGRILAVFLERDGATYRGTWEPFVTGRPLNVSDIEVGPDGALYFSIGGRGTEGGVYRVVYGDDTSPTPASADVPASADDAVRQLQPDAAWARARARAIKARLGDEWAPALTGIARDTSRSARERSRALTLLQQFGPLPDEGVLVALSSDGDARIRRTVVFLLGLRSGETTREALSARLIDPDGMVRRRACEAFVRSGLRAPVARLMPLLAEKDRWVRHAARAAIGRLEPVRYRGAILATDNPRVAVEGMLALIHRDAVQALSKNLAEKQVEVLGRELPDELLLDTLRLVQLTHIRGRDQGTMPAAMDAMRPSLLEAFDREDWRIKREAARLLAYLQEPRAIAKILDEMEKQPSRQQQIHSAYCLRTMKSGWTGADRQRLVNWFGRTHEWTGGASFPGYLDMLWGETLALLPPVERDEVLARLDDETRGRDDPPGEAIARATAAENRFAPEKLEQFLLRDPAGRRGDARKGHAVFVKAGCATCHKFGIQAPGRGLGPDLTTVAQRFKRGEILESILDPNKVISDQYSAVNVLTTDGGLIIGIPIKDDGKQIVLKRADGTELAIPRSKVVRTGKAISMMPEGMLNVLDLEEIADLFAYLEARPADADVQER